MARETRTSTVGLFVSFLHSYTSIRIQLMIINKYWLCTGLAWV